MEMPMTLPSSDRTDPFLRLANPKRNETYRGWLKSKSISHHFETMVETIQLVFTRESAFQDFLGGAGVRPSTVGVLFGGK